VNNGSQPEHLRVRNWDKYQSPARQSGWRPPWCKLYWQAWDDYDYCQLSLEERGLLAEMYRLATKRNNQLPADARQIAHEIRVNDVELVENGLDKLMSTRFLQLVDTLSSLEVDVEVEKTYVGKESKRSRLRRLSGRD
jgi:hypothetical protein